MPIKGMRDILTTHSLTSRSVPTTRAQIVTHLARAEHEKARLERELRMWVDNQKQTERRLHRAIERIEVLHDALDKVSPRKRKGARQGPVRVRPAPAREIPLEY